MTPSNPVDTPLVAAEPATDSRPCDGLRVLVFGVGSPMETFLDRLLTGLAGRGAVLTVLSPAPLPRQWLSDRGAVWHSGPGSLDARSVARAVQASGVRTASALARDLISRTGGRCIGLHRLLETVAPDVIYAPWINTVIEHPEVFASGIPVLVSCRGRMITIDPWDPARPGQTDGLRRVFERATRVHCVSQAMEAEAAQFGLDPARSTVITPAVDPDVFQPHHARPVHGSVDVLAVGSLAWRKDYEHALLALRHAVDQGADVRLTILGDGPDQQHLEFSALDLGLAGRVELVGQQTPAQVAERLQSAEVFLHTSCSEGISNAVLEAMASGLPVVTTNAGGMAEAVRDGIDGFVVPVRDESTCGSALVRLVADADLRTRMGASARQRVIDRFRLDQQLDAFCHLLHDTARHR